MQPDISLERVRISNPAWAGTADFFKAERPRVRLDLQERLQRRAKFLSIDIKGGVLHQERSQDGASTWDLSLSGSAESSPFGLRIQQVKLNKGQPGKL